ncbi:MAG: insulinase family protein [Candidatus Rokubacteria bacterium]|nr:insulinase family protein [Candidatus Rokubacteria bacterium]MBI2494402.1 insulinase family protein [Candidatus Rokubacteria bacterium]MBI4255738.1 insulinase family protein [Candidatus Rokubacteria bacterium]
MRHAAVLATLVLAAVTLAPGAGQADAPGLARRVLANGLTVLVREDAAAPVVAVSLQVRAGSRYETADTAGITNFLLRAMLRGTATRSAVELAEAAEALGGTLDAAGEVEAAELRGAALARHWEALLGLVAEVALGPALRPDEIEKERRLLLGQLRTRGETPFQLAFDTLAGELYGPHPYARPSLGTRASLERVTRDALAAHHRAIWRPDRMVLAVSGHVPAERVLKAVERLLGRLPRPADSPAPAAPAPTPSTARRVLAHPARQAQVLVGYLGPGLGEPAYPAVRVLGALLGGGMAGRLFVELRDKRGLAYSVGALIPFRLDPAFVVTYVGTAPESAAAAEAGVLAELERARAAAPGEDELARAKAYVLGALAMDRRTNARRAWHLAFFEAVGLGADFPERYARAIEAVTAADVAAAARRYLARPTIVVLAPAR